MAGSRHTFSSEDRFLIGIQLDLFDNGLADVYVKAHGLKQRKQLLRNCPIQDCHNMIPNKPSSHYCTDCTIDEYLGQELITEFTKILA